MKKNEFAEMKKMEIKALQEKTQKTKSEIAGLIIDKNMNKMPNLRLIKSKRNELAKTLTVLKQKEMMEKLEKDAEKVEDKKNAG